MEEMRVVRTGCCHDCGGRCVLTVHVDGGTIVRIDTDESSEPQLRACARGRAYRQRVYHPDRLLRPLKRIGERGAGKFAPISWAEALDTVATQLRRVRDEHGAQAIFLLGGSGNQGEIHGRNRMRELLIYHGGFTEGWGGASFEGALYASMASYGTIRTGDTRDNLLHSKLIILWGWNPADTVWDTNTPYYLAKAKEAGISVVAVDPIYTDTVASLASTWLPIRPGTDGAALTAMANVIARRGLQDQAFLDRLTVGFSKFQEYLFGVEDGIEKTPAWAEAITGISADRIARLAVDYATRKPAALIAGWAPGRSARGEQYHRAAIVLAAMTGNVGRVGGNAAGFERAYASREGRRIKTPWNAVEDGAPARPYSLHQLHGGTNSTSARIHHTRVFDARLRGKAGGYPADLKLAYFVACNALNSRLNVNKGVEALRKLEFIVVHEQFITATAKFADIVLPVNTFLERNDVAVPWLGAPYYVFLNKVIDSLPESKSDHEIAVELSRRLEVPGYPVRSEEDLIEDFLSSRGDLTVEDAGTLRKEGSFHVRQEGPIISFKKQIEDAENNPFPTPSGKIEIYSQLLADMNDPLVPAVPKYVDTWENAGDKLAAKYPLQCLTTHFKRRTHSTLDMVPWLKELEPQAVTMSVSDAAARGIADGQQVRVFNERGEMITRCKVTERIMPGVVAIPQGAYFDPDERGVDRGGSSNVVTRDEPSLGGAWPTNTILVQVEAV